MMVCFDFGSSRKIHICGLCYGIVTLFVVKVEHDMKKEEIFHTCNRRIPLFITQAAERHLPLPKHEALLLMPYNTLNPVWGGFGNDF